MVLREEWGRLTTYVIDFLKFQNSSFARFLYGAGCLDTIGLKNLSFGKQSLRYLISYTLKKIYFTNL